MLSTGVASSVFNLSEPGRTDYDLRLKAGPFPLRVHPLFWVMAAVLGAMNFTRYPDSFNAIPPVLIVIWVVVIFFSILIHELGHAIAMRMYGESAHIVLYMMGGLAISGDEGYGMWQRQRARTTKEQVIISAAGPGAGFIFAAIIAGLVFAFGGNVEFRLYSYVIPIPEIQLYRGESLLDTILSQPASIYLIELIEAALYINVFWGIFNLLPVFPLDGGQIVRAIMTHTDPWQGVKRSLWVSLISSAVVALFGFTSGNRFIGIMFVMFAISTWQTIQQMDGRGGFGRGPW